MAMAEDAAWAHGAPLQQQIGSDTSARSCQPLRQPFLLDNLMEESIAWPPASTN